MAQPTAGLPKTKCGLEEEVSIVSYDRCEPGEKLLVDGAGVDGLSGILDRRPYLAVEEGEALVSGLGASSEDTGIANATWNEEQAGSVALISTHHSGEGIGNAQRALYLCDPNDQHQLYN